MLNHILVPTYTQMLGALSAWLGKAEETSRDRAQALLIARLAPDMFPLSTQIRFACVQAQEGVFRLRQETFPPSIAVLLDEGRNASEHPGSIADARARIAETLTLVEVARSRHAGDRSGDTDRSRAAAGHGVRPYRRAICPRLGACPNSTSTS